jgi:hypothetical protein
LLPTGQHTSVVKQDNENIRRTSRKRKRIAVPFDLTEWGKLLLNQIQELKLPKEIIDEKLVIFILCYLRDLIISQIIASSRM